jgi:hypothetical protein
MAAMTITAAVTTTIAAAMIGAIGIAATTIGCEEFHSLSKCTACKRNCLLPTLF